MKIDARFLVRLYPREWRERYGAELIELLDDRVRPRDVVNVICGAANEWVSHMTGLQLNAHETRCARALVQAAVTVMTFQVLVRPILGAIFGHDLPGASTLRGELFFGLFTGFVWSAAVLGPVAFLSALIDWQEVPYARGAATLLAALIAFKIASHAAWGPVVLVLTLASMWIGYRSASVAPETGFA